MEKAVTNLVAYIPVPNRQYLEWLEKHQPFKLYLVSQEIAESLIPRLRRNLGAVSVSLVASMIRATGMNGEVFVFNPDHIPLQTHFIMPDEDVCHAVAERYILRIGTKRTCELSPIWARWDMKAVQAKQPVIADVQVSTLESDRLRMRIARDLKYKSPDWWRQIGAVAFRGDQELACAYNTHLPNEYEVYIFGDPAINRDAGENIDISSALHAERAVISRCARCGIKTEGASLYVTTFPCPGCAGEIATAGFSRVFFEEGYSILGALETLRAHGVQIVHLKNPESA